MGRKGIGEAMGEAKGKPIEIPPREKIQNERANGAPTSEKSEQTAQERANCVSLSRLQQEPHELQSPSRIIHLPCI